MGPEILHLIEILIWPAVIIIVLACIYELALKMQDRYLSYKERNPTQNTQPPNQPEQPTAPPNTPQNNTVGRWRTEWSQHYDKLQWTAITVFNGLIGALFAYSYNRTESDPIIVFLGLWFTWLTFYYIASFGEMRDILHKDIPDDAEKRYLQNNLPTKRKLIQHPAFYLTLSLLNLGWLYLLGRDKNWPFLVVCTVLTIIVLGAIYYYKPKERQNKAN